MILDRQDQEEKIVALVLNAALLHKISFHVSRRGKEKAIKARKKVPIAGLITNYGRSA